MVNDWNDLREQLADSNMERNIARARGDAAIALASAQADVIEAIPWQALLSISRSGVVSDSDADALTAFLSAHAPLVPFGNDLLPGDVS